MSEWREVTISEIAEVIGGGTPSTKNEEYYGGNIPWICPKDLTNHKSVYISYGERNITELGLMKSSAKLMPKNSVLLTSRAPIGYLAIAHNELCTNQGFKSLVVNPEIADHRFVYYLLKKNVNALKSLGTGTTFAEISGTVVKNFRVKIPHISEQQEIAEILSSLDDKIELNTKINTELEKLAHTIYKQWFVDFEFPDENGNPYKTSGGEMVASELGMIPKGWSVVQVGDMLETISKTYPLKSREELIFLNTGDISRGEFLHTNYAKTDSLPGQAKKSIQKGDILYSEIRPANGRYAYVHFDAEDYVVSTKLMVLRSKVDLDSLFMYFIITQVDIIQQLQILAESRSGTFPQITYKELSNIKLALPDFEFCKVFLDRILMHYYENKFNNIRENKMLIDLRDQLISNLIK